MLLFHLFNGLPIELLVFKCDDSFQLGLARNVRSELAAICWRKREELPRCGLTFISSQILSAVNLLFLNSSNLSRKDNLTQIHMTSVDLFT